jgi:colicin import membrane protein
VVKVAADKAAAVKVAVDKATVEKVAADKAAVEKVAENKAAVEKAAVEKVAADKATVEKVAADKAAATKAAEGAVVKATMDVATMGTADQWAAVARTIVGTMGSRSGSSPIPTVECKRAAMLGGSSPPSKRFYDTWKHQYVEQLCSAIFLSFYSYCI